MSVVQVIIDQSSTITITGMHTYDRSLGGTFIGESGPAFPVAPVAGEWFWRTDQNILYRRDNDNASWVAVSATASTISVKSGVLIPGNFAGNPKKATVTFAAPFADTSYAITLAPATDGTKTFSLNYETKTVGGFTVNLNTNNLANLVEVGWHAVKNGS